MSLTCHVVTLLRQTEIKGGVHGFNITYLGRIIRTVIMKATT